MFYLNCCISKLNNKLVLICHQWIFYLTYLHNSNWHEKSRVTTASIVCNRFMSYHSFLALFLSYNCFCIIFHSRHSQLLNRGFRITVINSRHNDVNKMEIKDIITIAVSYVNWYKHYIHQNFINQKRTKNYTSVEMMSENVILKIVHWFVVG